MICTCTLFARQKREWKGGNVYAIVRYVYYVEAVQLYINNLLHKPIVDYLKNVHTHQILWEVQSWLEQEEDEEVAKKGLHLYIGSG